MVTIKAVESLQNITKVMTFLMVTLVLFCGVKTINGIIFVGRTLLDYL